MSFFQTITPFIEIVIITIMINYLLSFFWNTRSMDLMLGLLSFLLMFAISTWLHFYILHKILYLVGNVAVIAILIIFQPELRVALSKLSLKGKRYREINEFDRFLDELASAVYRMSDRRVGALIVIENEDNLDEFAHKAVMINAHFSQEMLESIFITSTPLHDGAVIIRDMTIVAAAVILPLAEDTPQLAKSMGTRHRAGLGISQVSDSLVVVISEETGKVSIARDGIMTRGVKLDRFKGVVRSIFNPAPQAKITKRFNIKEWLKR